MLGEVVKRLILATGATAIMAATQPAMHTHLQIRQESQQQLDPQPPSYMISFYDLSQNQELRAIEDHLKATDAAVAENGRNTVLLERESSDMQGATRVWFWLLGLMIAGIGVAFWRKETTKDKTE